MKIAIHPQFYDNVVVTCSCGNTFTTGSTKENIRVELCSQCHPFYTGTQKLIDTEGKVEKFARKQKQAEARKAEIVLKKKEEKTREERPNSLAEMVAAIRKQQKAS